MKKLDPKVREYFSKLGQKGGAISKRKITPEEQAKMQAARKKKGDKNGKV